MDGEAPSRVILVDSAQIAERGPVLFGETALTLHANGSIPPEAHGHADVVVVSAERARVDALCAQLVAAQCKRVRAWQIDLSEMQTREQVTEAAGGPLAPNIKPYSSPQAEPPANPGTPQTTAEPAGGEPDDYREPLDEDERAEVLRHEIRMASNVRHLRAVEDREANEAEWPEPVDQFEERPLPEWDYSWLPPAIEPFVSDQSAIGGWDAGMMGLQALVACAGCVSDQIKLRVKPQQDWLESARLWGLYYGGKSIGKTPALNTVFSHIEKMDHELAVEHIKAMSRYAKDMKVYDEQERVWVKKKASGEFGLVEPIPPAKPIDYQLVYEDFTTAALSETLGTGNERGAIGKMDELASLWERLDSFSNGRGTERQDVLKLYNGGAATINRIGRGKVAVDNWSLSIIGGIQDEVLGRIVSKLNLSNDGMIQRFLPYMVPRKTLGQERPADEAAKQQWVSMLTHLYALKPHLEPVRFSPDAQLLRVEVDLWVQATGEEFGLPLAITPFLDKFGGTFPRLCLTFWAIQCAAERRQVIGPEIPRETCDRAWRYLRDCIWQHALKLYSEVLSADPGSNNSVRQICTWLVCRNEIRPTVELRDFAQQCKEAWYPAAPENVRAQRRSGLINDLITHGWLRPANSPDKVGKLPTQYHVNPRIYERFAALRAEQMPKRKAAYVAMEASKAAKQGREAGAD